MTDQMINPAVSRRTLFGVSAGAAGVMPARAHGQPAGAPPTPRPPAGYVEVTLTVNGHDNRLSLDPRTTLLDALREHLQLTGSKKGCDHGQCGACTVLVNGRRRESCVTLAT